MSCCSFAANTVRLQLHAPAHNLANFMRTLALPETGIRVRRSAILRKCARWFSPTSIETELMRVSMIGRAGAHTARCARQRQCWSGSLQLKPPVGAACGLMGGIGPSGADPVARRPNRAASSVLIRSSRGRRTRQGMPGARRKLRAAGRPFFFDLRNWTCGPALDALEPGRGRRGPGRGLRAEGVHGG
jgi:hypothetical protein